MSTKNVSQEDSRHPSDLSIEDGPRCETVHNNLNETSGTLTNISTCVYSPRQTANNSDLTFSSKGLHFCNLNIQHIIPKADELRAIMANDKCPDILGLCETFLNPSVIDSQVEIDGYDLIRKDRIDTQNKAGGGLILYIRNWIKFKRRPEYEISKIETIWAEIELPNSKPSLLCSVYRPPSVHSEWIDLFEEELSIAQATGLEYLLMGDFNIDLNPCTNNKWSNLLQLFDLTQLVQEPTRVTQSSASLIDHVYSSHPKNISSCFVSKLSISDHFPVCFSRKIKNRISKNQHITTSYRCFKHFNEDNSLLNYGMIWKPSYQTKNRLMTIWPCGPPYF